jgi:hypothetical protein
MMVILLAGLVVVEKIELALALAAHDTALVIDAGVQMPVSPDRLPPGTQLQQVAPTGILAALATAPERVIIALPASFAPAELSGLIDQIYATITPDDVHTLALIDTRTCDCFPTLRQALEAEADQVIRLPVDMAAVAAELGL